MWAKWRRSLLGYSVRRKLPAQTGKLHDLGKYSEAFNHRLHGGPSVDHATAGAKIAVERWGGVIGKLMAFLRCGASCWAGKWKTVKGINPPHVKTAFWRCNSAQIFPLLITCGNKKSSSPKNLSAPPLKSRRASSFFSPTPSSHECSILAWWMPINLDTEAFYLNLEKQSQ